MTSEPAALEAVPALLRAAATAGERCPTDPEIGDHLYGLGLNYPADARPSALAARGLLRSEVYARNWRVVEIDGMRTKEPPTGGAPYRIIDGAGSRYVER